MDKNHVGIIDDIEEMVDGPTNSVVTVLVFVNGDHRRVHWRVPIVRCVTSHLSIDLYRETLKTPTRFNNNNQVLPRPSRVWEQEERRREKERKKDGKFPSLV